MPLGRWGEAQVAKGHAMRYKWELWAGQERPEVISYWVSYLR